MADRDRGRERRPRRAPEGRGRPRRADGGPLGGDLAGSLGLNTPAVTGDQQRTAPGGDRRTGRTRGAEPSGGPGRRPDLPRRSEPAGGSRRRDDDTGGPWPEIPDWAEPQLLGPDVRADLRGLSKHGAEFVAGHLVAASELVDTDPDRAWEHARAARSQGGRIAVVRETVGVVAYRAGHWAEAIAELRAARRMAGGPGLLAVMADAERALGKPQRALDLARSPEARHLDPASAAELTIVAAGARADLGQHDAALAALGAACREADPTAAHAHRLFYAYAALLEDRGQPAEAVDWFIRAADADADDETDAAERAQRLSRRTETDSP